MSEKRRLPESPEAVMPVKTTTRAAKAIKLKLAIVVCIFSGQSGWFCRLYIGPETNSEQWVGQLFVSEISFFSRV